MPRGPHDEEIDEQNPDVDHARKRRDEFLRARYPTGEPAPTEGKTEEEKDLNPDKPEEDPDQKPRQ